MSPYFLQLLFFFYIITKHIYFETHLSILLQLLFFSHDNKTYIFGSPCLNSLANVVFLHKNKPYIFGNPCLHIFADVVFLHNNKAYIFETHVSLFLQLSCWQCLMAFNGKKHVLGNSFTNALNCLKYESS